MKNSGTTHLIGSVPLKSVEQVFKTCSDEIGEYLFTLPDGEVGERIDYNSILAYRLYHEHPDIETIATPTVVSGKPEWWHVWGLYEQAWLFRLKDKVKNLKFETTHYSDAAISSYKIFYKMKSSGQLPEHLRFQVSIPPTLSSMGWFFFDSDDFELVYIAYQKLLLDQLEKILSFIPSNQLAIQWDGCWEILDIEKALPWAPLVDPWIRLARQTYVLSKDIPKDVMLGYHFCYGDIAHSHSFQPSDLSVAVEMTNFVIQNSGRRVDWVHFPIPINRNDLKFYEPLVGIKSTETKIYLGLIHLSDGIKGAKSRIKKAKKFLTNFGIASECGFGRRKPEQIIDLLHLHRIVAEHIS